MPTDTITAPRTHHLDRRADSVAERLLTTTAIDRRPPPTPEMDPLLSTPELAERLGVSTQWLEIGRHRGYGPPFIRLSPRRVRYKLSAVLAYLKQRSYTSTAQYDGGRPRKGAGDAAD